MATGAMVSVRVRGGVLGWRNVDIRCCWGGRRMTGVVAYGRGYAFLYKDVLSFIDIFFLLRKEGAHKRRGELCF
ncbi:hypothetical protein [Bartonella massiliensis]|uniref:hypothetical protein n=1 Tax=Bartonella massiliensis TaxID=929795 RepID=UPI00115B2EF9|nr:hypothetical protein [Bartonella massiliensis]